MTASVQRFRFQYPDRSIQKDRACNEAKTEKGARLEKKKERLEGRKGGPRGPEDERVASEWHTPARKSGRMLYYNKGHVGRNSETTDGWGEGPVVVRTR